MEIQRQLSTVTVKGPDVAVSLAGGGQAQVAIFLTMKDKKFFFRGKQTTPGSAQFAPGTYDCAGTVLAFDHSAVGDSYAAAIVVGGQPVAMTNGVLADSKTESSTFDFVLVVQ